MASYVPNTKDERQEMLEFCGYTSFEDMFSIIPDELKLKNPLNLPEGKSELETRRIVTKMAEKNKIFPHIFRGAGAYNHYIPSMVGNVLAKENFQTAYTPYQAEISQGILQSIFEYQTMICDLTGMDVSNASVYDGATAAAEAVAMCRSRKQNKVVVSEAVHPDVLAVIKTYVFGNEMELVTVPAKDGVTDIEALGAALDKEVSSVYIEQPNFFGNIEAAEAIADFTHEAGAKLIMGVNPMTTALLKSPREYGADVAVGDGQPLGLPMAFGGPYLGFMACTQKLMRQLPGRIVGQTQDDDGQVGYVLTLQAREQHIRREKASSNICSNQALCALAVGVYLTTMGNKGFAQVAKSSLANAHYLAKGLAEAGLKLENDTAFFNEFVTVSEKSSQAILDALEKEDILGGLPLDDNRILWCCTEMNTKEEMDNVIRLVKEVG